MSIKKAIPTPTYTVHRHLIFDNLPVGIDLPSSSSKASQKHVRFNYRVSITLIPSIRDLKASKLDEHLWWHSSELYRFKLEAQDEVQNMMKEHQADDKVAAHVTFNLINKVEEPSHRSPRFIPKKQLSARVIVSLMSSAAPTSPKSYYCSTQQHEDNESDSYSSSLPALTSSDDVL